jgi:hypothetical protein
LNQFLINQDLLISEMREKEERDALGQGRSWGPQKGYIHRLDREATTFFFTNFPEEVKAVDLWPRFARYGRVGEVFIPSKVDRQGKRFGFVKFREVKDATELLRSLSNIWMGSFKLRINLSKFKRRDEPVQAKDRRTEGGSGKLTEEGRPYKAVVMAEMEEWKEGRQATIGEGSNGGRKVDVVSKEVVWEVEEEEERVLSLEGAYVGYLVEEREAQSIQNNFRMAGFQNLRVTALGYRQILLWSESVDEVKMIVESAGWWCALFESVVPWSPELISNHRVTWLRCYGVPIHAWGVDLFRALAFKFGRFIEVDEDTHQFKRCDVARVKVVTKDSKLIDSSMAVKVRGKRFDIRVMEEWGGGSMTCGGSVKMGVGWQEEQSSRASIGGASNCAEVEGYYSESGTDADISESCQVLLELQAHGGDRSAAIGTNKELGYIEGEMSGNFPNLLGNSVVPLVNQDCDMGVGTSLESDQVLENVTSVIRSGVLGELNNSQGLEFVSGDKVGPERTCPSQGVGGADGSIGLDSKGAVRILGPSSGPKILRTRKGDLNLRKPVPRNCSGPGGVPLANGLEFVGKAQFPESSRKTSSRKDIAKSHNHNGPSKPKRDNRKSIPNLPFNKFNKFPGFGQHATKRKKSSKVAVDDNNKETVDLAESDSISDDGNDSTGIVLEVVLPGVSAPPAASAPLPGRVVSGMDSLLNSDGDDVVQDRQTVLATKLFDIAEEVGVKFHGGEGDDLTKLMVMEDRDCEEKKEWEKKRGISSDQ